MKNKTFEIIILILALFLVLSMAMVLLKIALLLAILLLLRTWYLQNKGNENQKQFIAGTVPTTRPDGFYQGTVGTWKVSWAGKTFNAATASGINIFEKNGTKTQAHPFKTANKKGLYEKNLEVIAIDYNQPENPFWIRIVHDEIVEVTPGEYLGKTMLKIIPSWPFTILYFRLKKA